MTSSMTDLHVFICTRMLPQKPFFRQNRVSGASLPPCLERVMVLLSVTPLLLGHNPLLIPCKSRNLLR